MIDINTDYLKYPWVLCCCRDRTITVREWGKMSFNNVAIPVYSVPTFEEAQDLQILCCELVPHQHPRMKPGQPWYKLTAMNIREKFNFKLYLDPEDIKDVSDFLHRRYCDFVLPRYS